MPGGSRQADARTDVFQLGKMLYQMITGRSPAVVEPAALPPGTRPHCRACHLDSSQPTATRKSPHLLEAVETYQQLRGAGSRQIIPTTFLEETREPDAQPVRNP